MRCYCVHPNLPLQAELRIRSAPDSSAPERCRISQGRAIVTCSTLLQARGIDDDATTTSWLQVVYLDTASGETEEGFVMAVSPNGMSLVTPWETTRFWGCCEVVDPATLMFDGPQDVARSLGVVQSIAFLYCVMEESETRVRIFHPKLEMVWVDKENVQVKCTRLEHEECSTAHAFYEMNNKLPVEAQIAVREFPSQEAQMVGLLSRDETLEITTRSGNWLQIVGGSFDKAWIMFRIDALELLHEARDVCSSNCRRIQGDVDDIVNVENTANQTFCADTYMVSLPSNQVASNKTASTLVLETDHELDAADAREMEDENATVTMDGFSEMTVNADIAERLQAWKNCSPCPVQRVVVGDDSANDTATLRTDASDDVGNTSALGPAVDTTVEVAEPVQAIQASDGGLIRSALCTHDEAYVDSVDDLADAAGCVHSNDTNMENEQIGNSWCTRPIQPARAVSNEVEDDGSTIAGDGEDMAICKEDDMKEIEYGKSAQNVSLQGELSTRPLRNASDPNDAVTEAVANAVPQKTKMIVADSKDINDVGTVVASLSWDDRSIRPARMVAARNNCSAGSDNFAVSKTKDAVPEHGSLSWGNSLRITATMNDGIGDNGDATAVISANNVVYDIAVETTKLLQHTELWDSHPIWSAPLDRDEAQVGNEDTTTRNGAVNFVTVATCDDECANGKKFGQAHPDDVGANGSTTACVDEGISVARFNVKDSAGEGLGILHVEQPGHDRPVRPAEIVMNRIGNNDAGGTFATVTELVVFDTVDSSKARDDICTTSYETETTRPSQFAQPWDDRPNQSLSKNSNEADNENFDPECDNLCYRPTYVMHDDDGTVPLTVGKEAQSNVMEPSQSWDQQLMWPEQAMPGAPADSDVRRKRIGTAVADATFAGRHSVNDAKVENSRPNKHALKDRVTAVGANNAAVSATLIAAVKNVGDRAIANEIHYINVRSIVKDEVEAVTRVQTATSQDYLSALGGSTIVFSGADIETVEDRHNSPPMTSLSVFERCYAESETTSGSENGEIALLGSLEDVFEPVDEWLSATQEEDIKEFGNDSLVALPRTESPRDRGIVMNGRNQQWSRAPFPQEQEDGSSLFYSAFNSAEEKTQNGVAVQPTGISFLQVFGIRKYCEHKQNFITPSDELSVAMYEANEDDSDLVFQALVGDDSLSDDWFYDLFLHHFQAYTHSSIRGGYLLSACPRSTFDLIMSDASPEDILAAELSDDDCGDFDLVISFQYPVPRRKVVGSSRPPPFFLGRVHSAPAGTEAETTGATNKSGVAAKGTSPASRQPSLTSHRTSTITSQGELAICAADPSSKTALSKQCIGQPKMPTPSSRLRRSSIMTPITVSSIVRPRSLMQPLHSVNSANSASSGLSVSSTCATSTSSVLPSAQRRSLVSMPSALRAGLVRNNITGLPKPAEVSGLSAPRKYFGFRHPSGLTKRT